MTGPMHGAVDLGRALLQIACCSDGDVGLRIKKKCILLDSCLFLVLVESDGVCYLVAVNLQSHPAHLRLEVKGCDMKLYEGQRDADRGGFTIQSNCARILMQYNGSGARYAMRYAVQQNLKNHLWTISDAELWPETEEVARITFQPNPSIPGPADPSMPNQNVRIPGLLMEQRLIKWKSPQQVGATFLGGMLSSQYSIGGLGGFDASKPPLLFANKGPGYLEGKLSVAAGIGRGV
eukprot:CAMPEP_0184302292 /NCGR_PEP_ID=MMETSP1049-20130417/12304_1 /TAXON_ID=77928 /ORGANISM="Proteomonas sulcata, Strain CCMP704" /LENGTH=234 /DNA_ID=CAMNT_0026613551 /DNA_START=44 /DNA_END=748 /DNA_ORIENTATION=+